MQESNTQDTENENETVEVTLEQPDSTADNQNTTEVGTTETQTAEKSTESAPQAEEQELENHSEKVRKRIAQLTGKMREAERREKAALEYAQSVQKQLEENRQKTTSLDTSFVNEFENRVTLQNEMLQTQLKEAIDRGDVDKQVEAQKQLATVAHENERLKYVKQQREQQQKAAEAAAPQQQQQPQQIPQRKPDPKANNWAQQNEWFGQDEPMTLTAFSIHKKMIEEEGWDGASDEYYSELDKRMRNEFPHKFNSGAPSTGRNSPAVASASRTTTKGKKTMKLTPSQVVIAKKLGVSLEAYAKQVARLNP
jgi:hypothetical protein